MTYRELLDLYTDFSALSLPPQAGERGGCMSSYDRASRYDEATGQYLEWDANEDGNGFVRQNEDGSIIAFEREGPGCVFRSWSALPKQGHIRVYIDHSNEPVIDTPFIDWFESQPGDIPPLNLSELSLRLSRGRNCWIPIPYQRHCRIELCEGWGAYYHFTYRDFPLGTQMPAYEERFTRDGMIALAELDARLYDRDMLFDKCDFIRLHKELSAHSKTVVFNTQGSGAIDCLRVLLRPFVPRRDEALANLRIQMYWDGDSEPAVDAPIGAFFGSDDGVYPYSSLPFSVQREAMECRFYMPYERGAVIVLVNSSDEVIAFEGEVHTVHCDDAHARLRFHAFHHHGLSSELNTADFEPGGQRWPDWAMLLAKGTGRFCGAHLRINNTWREPEQPAESWWYGKWDRKNVDWWWGEGDEKFFVDSEKFPSTFGTGSEDYIGYAWAAEPPFAKFQCPYAVMNRMPINGNGVTYVSRFHIADCVPFLRSFEAFLEKYKADRWGEDGRCVYDCVPYWYQA